MVIAETGLHQPRKGTIERVFGFFLRLLAVYALISGLVYWAGLTGIAGGGQWRFDLLAPSVRIVFTTLAVLMPAAALGLWLATRWGVVLWVLAATAEIAAYMFLTGTYSLRAGIAGANMIGLIGLVLMAGATLIERRTARIAAP
ncbi:MAG: hypothetical protein JJ920_13865 [Roseitalea sp.]|jgi:hypothetical protein|nr:hypothetical protein [Roseitalea sp.]MBO6722811.1 hypothetical protein [Roseitalea sp.]MBO6743995.1 hypothetical protein [Roseitalea sp.]